MINFLENQTLEKREKIDAELIDVLNKKSFLETLLNDKNIKEEDKIQIKNEIEKLNEISYYLFNF
jgi:hypothetical protein